MIPIKDIIKGKKSPLSVEPFCSNTFIFEKKDTENYLKHFPTKEKQDFLKNKNCINSSILENNKNTSDIHYVMLFHSEDEIVGIFKALDIENLASETRYLALATFLYSAGNKLHNYSTRDILSKINQLCIEYFAKIGKTVMISSKTADLSTIEEFIVY